MSRRSATTTRPAWTPTPIDAKGLAPVQPLLDEIDAVTSKDELPALIGKLQRMGVDVFFGYGEQQDLKDATKQIAVIDQDGLGLPEKDYYLRTGAKDETLRQQYVAHVAKMLTLAGSTPEQAQKDATAIMAFETALAKAPWASPRCATRRRPITCSRLRPSRRAFPVSTSARFEDAIHSPRVSELNNATPEFLPALMQQIQRDGPRDAEGVHALSPAHRGRGTAAEAVR